MDVVFRKGEKAKKLFKKVLNCVKIDGPKIRKNLIYRRSGAAPPSGERGAAKNRAPPERQGLKNCLV